MPTPSEQKALAFVAMVIVLGGAMRVLRAGSAPTASVAEQQALARQGMAAESAATRDGRGGGGKGRGRRSGRAALAPPETAAKPPLSPTGFPPPSPRIDLDNRLPTGMVVVGGAGGPQAPLIDLDVASAHEIEALPRIGPALAARIVASRDSGGPFGSLEGLGRVPGVGPAMLRILSGRVTFSGRGASSEVRTRYPKGVAVPIRLRAPPGNS